VQRQPRQGLAGAIKVSDRVFRVVRFYLPRLSKAAATNSASTQLTIHLSWDCAREALSEPQERALSGLHNVNFVFARPVTLASIILEQPHFITSVNPFPWQILWRLLDRVSEQIHKHLGLLPTDVFYQRRSN